MHIFPSANEFRNYEVKFFASKAENKQIKKDAKIEEKLLKEHKFWLDWFMEHAVDM